jgi:hypothetical protein
VGVVAPESYFNFNFGIYNLSLVQPLAAIRCFSDCTAQQF